ncbi:hypothetical protein PMAYCL1PPCAC_08579, partial [Pristionchus mayeri]
LEAFFIMAHVISNAHAATSVSFYGITDELKPEDEKYSHALNTAAAAFMEAEELFDDRDFVVRRGWEKEAETSEGDV